jgi:hypothetical protein
MTAASSSSTRKEHPRANEIRNLINVIQQHHDDDLTLDTHDKYVYSYTPFRQVVEGEHSFAGDIERIHELMDRRKSIKMIQIGREVDIRFYPDIDVLKGEVIRSVRLMTTTGEKLSFGEADQWIETRSEEEQLYVEEQTRLRRPVKLDKQFQKIKSLVASIQELRDSKNRYLKVELDNFLAYHDKVQTWLEDIITAWVDEDVLPGDADFDISEEDIISLRRNYGDELLQVVGHGHGLGYFDSHIFEHERMLRVLNEALGVRRDTMSDMDIDLLRAIYNDPTLTKVKLGFEKGFYNHWAPFNSEMHYFPIESVYKSWALAIKNSRHIKELTLSASPEFIERRWWSDRNARFEDLQRQEQHPEANIAVRPFPEYAFKNMFMPIANALKDNETITDLVIDGFIPLGSDLFFDKDKARTVFVPHVVEAVESFKHFLSSSPSLRVVQIYNSFREHSEIIKSVMMSLSVNKKLVQFDVMARDSDPTDVLLRSVWHQALGLLRGGHGFGIKSSRLDLYYSESAVRDVSNMIKNSNSLETFIVRMHTNRSRGPEGGYQTQISVDDFKDIIQAASENTSMRYLHIFLFDSGHMDAVSMRDIQEIQDLIDGAPHLRVVHVSATDTETKKSTPDIKKLQDIINMRILRPRVAGDRVRTLFQLAYSAAELAETVYSRTDIIDSIPEVIWDRLEGVVQEQSRIDFNIGKMFKSKYTFSVDIEMARNRLSGMTFERAVEFFGTDNPGRWNLAMLEPDYAEDLYEPVYLNSDIELADTSLVFKEDYDPNDREVEASSSTAAASSGTMGIRTIDYFPDSSDEESEESIPDDTGRRARFSDPYEGLWDLDL